MPRAATSRIRGELYTVKMSRGNLNRERVVKAALELIDEEGLDALSMRRLGRKLGVEGMALYTYVDSKEDLLDAVGEHVLSALDVADVPAEDWRGRIRALVHAWSKLQLRHPNAFPLIYRARPWTSLDFEVLEETFDALAAAGLDPAQAALAYSSMIGALDGMLFAGYLTTYNARETWLRGRREADPQRFPRYRAAASEAAKLRGADIFEHTLDLLLRGLER